MNNVLFGQSIFLKIKDNPKPVFETASLAPFLHFGSKMLMWFIFIPKKKNMENSCSVSLFREFFSYASPLTSSLPSVLSLHMWLSMICNKSEHLKIPRFGCLCCFSVQHFQGDDTMLSPWYPRNFHVVKPLTALSYFWIKIYFISHLTSIVGQKQVLLMLLTITKMNFQVWLRWHCKVNYLVGNMFIKVLVHVSWILLVLSSATHTGVK